MVFSTWSSATSRSNHYNFPTSRKLLTGTIVSFGQLIPLMPASMIAPSLGVMTSDLHIRAATTQIAMSS
ncbi:hypothetical protein BKA63DRAFT_583281 [Paraphoma chrysanthemicola]|nr:hypothetical protein BKA63DRAFT_583281 [Paraphoma chrysanthemicola]